MSTKENLLELTSSSFAGPGVYSFENRDGKIIYVGKSINVRQRVLSHIQAVGTKSQNITQEAVKVSAIPVFSELEALLLEAELIKKYLPKYNSAAKDDKHPLYIKITREEFPKVALSRAEVGKGRYFGPFPSSSVVKSVLRQIRKVFPYCSQKRIGKGTCFYSHIGLCHPCPNEINSVLDLDSRLRLIQQYKSSIRKVVMLLSGKTKRLEKQLLGEMKGAVLREDFEAAAQTRDQLRQLHYITHPYEKPKAYLENPNLVADIREEEGRTLCNVLSPYFTQLTIPNRIEAYDVAHTGGQATTCSMITFINGEPDKNFYRRFKIRKVKGADDYSALREALTRRLAHLNDWGTPDLILIDGGKGQVTAVKEVLALHPRGVDTFPPRGWSLEIPVIGLAKRLEEIVIPLDNGEFKSIILGRRNPATHLLQRIRDEAHRFARSYHFKLRLKDLLQK